MSKIVHIDKNRLRELLEKEMELEILEAGGVDNWPNEGGFAEYFEDEILGLKEEYLSGQTFENEEEFCDALDEVELSYADERKIKEQHVEYILKQEVKKYGCKCKK